MVLVIILIAFVMVANKLVFSYCSDASNSGFMRDAVCYKIDLIKKVF